MPGAPDAANVDVFPVVCGCPLPLSVFRSWSAPCGSNGASVPTPDNAELGANRDLRKNGDTDAVFLLRPFLLGSEAVVAATVDPRAATTGVPLIGVRSSVSQSRTTIMRLLLCMFVSVGTTVLSAVILVTLVLGFGVRAGTANVIAVGCGIGPSYAGNRRFVWRRSERSSVVREIAPFWTLSLAGLILSTWTVAVVAAKTSQWPSSSRAIMLPAAHIAGFGALWVAQFVLLDRVIFRDRRSSRSRRCVPR